MDARNRDRLFARLTEVQEVSETYKKLIEKLINLHSEYADLIEQDDYPEKGAVKKLQATIKKFEKNLRITKNKLDFAYEKLINQEILEHNVIKQNLHKG